MKKNLVLAGLSLLVFAIAASAQKATDFSGTWNLDIARSKLSEREKGSIQSQTLTVTQTATAITAVTVTQRNAPPVGAIAGGPPPTEGTLPKPSGVPLGELVRGSGATAGGPPAGGPPPGGMGGGRPGGGMMGGGDGTVTYTLDGKEVKSEISGQMGTMQVSTKAKLDGGKLEITRTVGTSMGDRTTTEKWTLGTDGNLSVETQRPNRDGGMDTSTKVYTKKQ